jgi:hypothetical protein
MTKRGKKRSGRKCPEYPPDLVLVCKNEPATSRRDWILEAMKREALKSGRAKNYKLWRDDNHAVEIDGFIVKIDDRIHYIHGNPVRNGLVENAWEYRYSSARDCEINRKGLVNVELA